MKNLSLFAAALLLVIGSSTRANAWGGYDPVEHPFDFIGQNQDQTYGDSVCQQRYGQLISASNNSYSDFNIGSNGVNGNFGYNGTGVFAFDNVEITGAWHVWYHQRKGTCVANKG